MTSTCFETSGCCVGRHCCLHECFDCADVPLRNCSLTWLASSFNGLTDARYVWVYCFGIPTASWQIAFHPAAVDPGSFENAFEISLLQSLNNNICVAQNGLLCADVPLRNCSLTHSFESVIPISKCYCRWFITLSCIEECESAQGQIPQFIKPSG